MALENALEVLIADPEVIFLAEDPGVFGEDPMELRAFFDPSLCLWIEDDILKRGDEL